jgi:hypothetical protein
MSQLYRLLFISARQIKGRTSWVNLVESSDEGDDFADMVEAADPGYGSPDAEAAVWERNRGYLTLLLLWKLLPHP